MPQKTFEGVFCHVILIAFLFEMPQNRRISFSIPFQIFQTAFQVFRT